jgi:hypothetical protein
MICIPPILYHFLPRITIGARSGVVFTPAPISILGCVALKIQVHETGLFEKLPYWNMGKKTLGILFKYITIHTQLI